MLDTQVTELLGDASGLAAVRLSKPLGDRDILEVHNLFVEIGAEPRSALARRLGAAIDPETGEVVVDRLMRTNVEGLFAAGDLTNGSGPLKQTVTAAAQGAITASSAYEFITAPGRRCVTGGRPSSIGRSLRDTGMAAQRASTTAQADRGARPLAV